MKPKISVIIPVYNVEKYLRECLDSVCAQTFNDFEVICVDDGSTDSSPAILDEYAAKDRRFKVLRNEHSNAGVCRNAGMDIAQGEYCSFLDSDDVFSPKMLEILVSVADSSNADIVSCSHKRFNDGDKCSLYCAKNKGIQYEVFDSPADNINVFSKWGAMAWDKLFRRSFVNEHSLRFQEIRWTNDLRFVMMAVTLAKRIAHVEIPLLGYRQGHVSLQTTKAAKALCFYEALQSYREMIIARNMMTEFLDRHFRRFAVWFFFHHMDRMENAEAYETVHNAFSSLCREWKLTELTENDFHDNGELFIRFDRIRKGCTPMESLRLHEQMLMKVVAELQPLRYYPKSKDYRLGHFLLAIPRAVKGDLTRMMRL